MDNIDIFCQVTKLSRPPMGLSNGVTEDEIKKWLSPLKSMYESVNKSDEDLRRGLMLAKKAMYDKGLTFSCPAAIQPEFARIVSGWNDKSNEPSQADFERYRIKMVRLGYNVKY